MEKECFQNFAFGIIVQAVRDYQTAFQALKKNPHNNAARANLDEVMVFFRSPWYRCLTDIPCDVLMDLIENKKGPIKIYRKSERKLQ